MAEDIQIIGDERGLTIIGDLTDVERFLSSEGLESQEIDLSKAGMFASAGAVLQSGSELLQQTGRWVQLTEESAAKIKKFGLIRSNSTGLYTGVIGKGGRAGIKGNVQFVSGPARVNPAMLANVGVLMTQLAMQQMMQQISDYLETIDEKIDEVLRAQKDAEIAKMIGAAIVIREAAAEREHTGGVSEITWSEVQATKQTLATVRAYALRQLDAFADKLECTSDIGKLLQIMQCGDSEVREWLAVLAKCLQLQEGYTVLKLDRVLGSTPDKLNQYRLAEQTNSRQRLELVSRSVTKLATRINDASEKANKQVLFHPLDSPKVVSIGNDIAARVGDFSELLNLEAEFMSVDSRPWLEAADMARQDILEKGAEGVKVIAQDGTQAMQIVGENVKRGIDGAGRVIGDIKGKAAIGTDKARESASNALHGAKNTVSDVFSGFFDKG